MKNKRNLSTNSLKYTIKKRTMQLLGERHKTMAAICNECLISQSTLYRWCNIETGSSESIPFDSMLIIAKHLKCEPIELKNNG